LRRRLGSPIDLYILHYEDSFVELFRDSGLWNEEMILAGYRDSASKLFQSLYGTVEERLSGTRVLGRQKAGKRLQRLVITIGDRVVILHYSENKKERIRCVETISIHRA
jgi:hypothetical protein